MAKPVFFIVAVCTIDGKIARNSKHMTDWSSKEDKDFLHEKMDGADVILVGRTTFEVAKEPLSKRNCIVFTSSVKKPEKRGNAVFLNPENSDIAAYASKMGYKKICVLGGSKTYSYLVENDLADEIFLTIEPLVFGEGINIFSREVGTKKFELLKMQKLNEHGTVLLHYRRLLQ